MANDPTIPAGGASLDAPPPSREQAFAARYSTQEKLLLAQAVYKLGAAKWEGISQLLTEHPCIADKSPEALDEMFSPQACEDGYVGLMTDIGINVPAEGGIKPHAKPHLRLAQTYYIARMAELKTSIAGYEQRFATLMSEIQMIKSGEMDGAIAAELRAVLVKKFGKKLMDAWVPESTEVGAAAEAGPVSEEERREKDEAVAKEKKAAEDEKARVEKEREEAAAAEERRKAEEAEAEAAAIGEKAEAEELKAPAALVQYSSPVDAPEEAAEEAEEAPAEQEELLPPIPRRKKGGRSQKGVSVEKHAEPETEEAGVEDEAEGGPDITTEPAVEEKAEGKKRPKRGSAADEAPAKEAEATSPAAAVHPTPAPGRSTRRGKEAAAAPPAETTDDVEMPEALLQPQGRSTRKGKTQTPAPEPDLPQQSEDVEMGDEEDEAEPPAEEEAEVPQHDTRRRPSKPDVHVPTQSSRSRSKRPTTPATTAEPKAASASPLTSEPDGASPPAETSVKPKSRSKTKAAPKRNSRGNKEAEAEEEEEKQAAEEETSAPSKRGGNKRKAAVPPSGAPAGKRKGGRRGTSPAPTIATVPDSDVDPEEPEAEEAESSRGKRGSMPAPLLSASSAPRRGRPPKESPGLSARTRGSSPSASRRAQSVTSTASAATPKPGTGATAKRGRGRPSRAQIAAKEEEDEEGEGEDEEEEEEGVGERAQRSKARGKGTEVEVAVSADGPKRSHARKPRAEDNVEVDMSAPPAKRSHQKKVADEPAEKKSQGKKGKVEEVDAPSRPKRESLRAQQTRPDPLVLGEGSEPPPSTAGSLSLSPKKERGEPALSEGAPTTASARTSLGGTRRRKKDETPEERNVEERDQKRVMKLLMGLLDTVSAHKNGNVFQNPVRKSDAPDYFEIVKQPMDLKTMRLRIKNGQISTLDEFERDVHLIFANAMMYNEEGSQVYEMAEEMLKDAEGHLARFRVMQQDLGQ